MMYNLIPSAIAPITKDGTIDLVGLDAIVIRNAGTAIVNLWNGLYTLDSKETLSFNVTESGAVLNVQNVPVSFDTSSGGTPSLQIIVIKKQNC